MKIAIPVDEKSLDSNVCVSFGRTPYFLIYDVDTKESVFLDNSAAASTGGTGTGFLAGVFDLDMVAQRHIENGLTAGGIDHHPLGAQRLVGQKNNLRRFLPLRWAASAPVDRQNYRFTIDRPGRTGSCPLAPNTNTCAPRRPTLW